MVALRRVVGMGIDVICSERRWDVPEGRARPAVKIHSTAGSVSRQRLIQRQLTRIEIYSTGSLDALAYTCTAHNAGPLAAITEAGLPPDVVRIC